MKSVQSICILGGGTAGFVTASMLARYKELSGSSFDITVVYSASIGNVGVGESTLATINELFSYLGLADKDWMPKCSATYKTSISFEDFYTLDTQFQYPFGVYRHHDPGHAHAWFELKDHYPEIFTPDTFAKYILPWTRLNEQNKLTKDQCFPNYSFDDVSAYHFDTHYLGTFLRDYCLDRGVTCIDDKFLEAKLNDDNYITEIVCESCTVAADLFVDCSGFSSLLLGGVMKSKFIDFGDTLINHRAVRAKVAYKDRDKQLTNYTNCHALKNGWCWEIPLYDYMSLGYVHSLRFADESEIVAEFIEHCARQGFEVSEDSIDVINYKTGRREQGWVNNVVGIGLSYGFLEPLESTGILTLTNNAFRLLEMLSKRNMRFTEIDRACFNRSTGERVDGLRGFIELHYAMSLRDDSKYWRHVTEKVKYPSGPGTCYEAALHMTTESRFYVENNSNKNGLAFILAAMGYSPYSPAFNIQNKASHRLEILKQSYLHDDGHYKELVSQMPSSFQFLQQNVYADRAEGTSQPDKLLTTSAGS